MYFSRSIKFSFALVFLGYGLSATSPRQAVNPKQDTANPHEPLKAISTPMAPYPEEALKKGIEGKVTLTIVVDAKGNVSQAKAVSGPAELVPAAIASVKMWKFEPPAHAPVTKTTWVAYGHPRECPGPVSESGEVTGGGGLVDKNGKLVAVAENPQYPSPPYYPEAERKAGVAGRLVLSVGLDSDGRVKEIHAIKSLSPTLDRMAIDAVRAVTFKQIGNSTASLEDLRMQFVFRATCHPVFE